MSRPRARCPHCRTLTAVAHGPEYQCHSCGGERMAEAAWLELPHPEASVVNEASLAEQTLALAADLPDRPLVLGGGCCAHVGAVEGLTPRGTGWPARD